MPSGGPFCVNPAYRNSGAYSFVTGKQWEFLDTLGLDHASKDET